MSYTFSWLCWMSAWLLLCFWAVSAGTYNPSSSTLQAKSPAPVGLRGYKRYFANDSLIGRPVSCTREDKICFRHNLVFDPQLDKCQSLGGGRPGCDLRLNRIEFEQGFDRVVGSCLGYRDQCPGYLMAYDGICYKREIVKGVICGRDAYLTRHPFGGEECFLGLDTPVSIKQPQEDGACMIPDLRFPDIGRQFYYNNPLNDIQGFENENPYSTARPNPLQCTTDQAACFSKAKVFVPGYGGCHTLLKRGPCAEDHVVALDLQAATEGRAEGTCVDVRGGCPKGYTRMIFDGECHADRDIAIVAPGKATLNQFGRTIVTSLSFAGFSPALNNKVCLIHINLYEAGYVVPVSNPPCGSNNMGECKLLEAINEPPIPEL